MGWSSDAATLASASGSLVPPLVLPLVPLVMVTLLALAPYRRRVFIALLTLRRDFRFIYRFGMVMLHCRYLLYRNSSVVKLFRKNAAQHPDKACFVFEGTTWTFADVEAYSNRVARVFQKEGFQKGDTVALMMENRPEYICLWLGLAKLRVVTAFINTNLRCEPLAHSLRAAHCRAVLTSPGLVPAVREADPSAAVFVLGAGEGAGEGAARPLDPLLEAQDPQPPEGEPEPSYRDPLLYIYTSGTTGLPKAAVMLNSRFLLMVMAAKYILPLRSDDVIYNPLPLYHTAGGVLGCGCAIVDGVTVVIRPKFSASAYLPECVRYGCTIGQYIGEICRYLMSVPARPEDTKHRLRLMMGNGMRPQIWRSFVERFKVPQICELYGATEGNANIVNIDNTVGAVGFLPRFLPLSLLPMGLVRIDEATGEPVRGPDGLCQRCDAGEPGMFIGVIDTKNAMREFHGYVDKNETRKKVISDVFKKGDQAFLSGDILVMDDYGYLFFRDRTGDTFRWKGENVSTAEVEAVISSVINLKDATVYGVEVPEVEGRAGMAAVADPDGSLDLARLAAGVQRSLPAYARPLFLRVVHRLELTGTFKLKKVELQREGFDPARVPQGDRLYLLRDGAYQPLDERVHQQIVDGTLRL